jgi:hypothetical protein
MILPQQTIIILPAGCAPRPPCDLWWSRAPYCCGGRSAADQHPLGIGCEGRPARDVRLAAKHPCPPMPACHAMPARPGAHAIYIPYRHHCAACCLDILYRAMAMPARPGAHAIYIPYRHHCAACCLDILYRAMAMPARPGAHAIYIPYRHHCIYHTRDTGITLSLTLSPHAVCTGAVVWSATWVF